MLAQIQAIDGQLEQAVEAYNLANVRLERIEAELTTNARHLAIARKNLKRAQTHLSRAPRRAVHVDGDEGTRRSRCCSAQSIDDLLNRLDAVDRVSAQDTRVLGEVKSFRTTSSCGGAAEAREGASRSRSSPSGGRSRQSIEGQLAERKQLLASIHGEIAQLQAAERRRQARLAARRGRGFAERRRGQDAVRQSADVRARSRRARSSVRGRAALPLRRGGRDRDAVPGRPVRLGRRHPVRLRLLRLRDVRLRARSASRCRTTRPRSTARASRSRATSSSPATSSSSTGSATSGIYIGGGQFIHSPHTGDVVKISSLTDSWYAATSSARAGSSDGS